MVEMYIAHAERQIDQIRRRVYDGEKIPHKVFSIFEEHTEWISKGKAGVPQEFGLGVCVLQDQYGFILHHHVMEKQKDVDIAFDRCQDPPKKFRASKTHRAHGCIGPENMYCHFPVYNCLRK
jgi:hypothetical protein